MALADINDVEMALGRALTSDELARVDTLLQHATAAYCREAQRTFEGGTATVRLLANNGRVYLPERNITEVASVTDEDGFAVAFTRDGQWVEVNDETFTAGRVLIVTYSWGANVPDLDRLNVAEAVKRCLTIAPEAAMGASQANETVGPYARSATFAPWVIGGAVTLSPQERADARRWRRPKMIVQRP